MVELNEYLSSANAAELFAACRQKSFEQVELLLAARFPKPDVRDRVRRLPVRTASLPDIGSTATATAAALPLATNPAHRAGAVRPLSADRFGVNFTADAEFRELPEEVRALVSHAEPKGDLMNVMKRALSALKTELLKKRYGVGRKPRRVSVSKGGTGLATRTRHVAADVTRAVWERDGGWCTFSAADGRRCSERHFLQLDHIHPYAVGGKATLGNLRLRCRAHNLHAARSHFGARFMRACNEREARCCAEPAIAPSHGARSGRVTSWPSARRGA